MKFQTITKDEFKRFATENSESFLQTSAMSELLEKRGWQTTFVAVKSDGNEIQIAALLHFQKVFGGTRFDCNFGPIHTEFDLKSYEFFIKELQKFVKSENAIEFNWYPNIDFQTFDAKGEKTSEPKNDLVHLIESWNFNYLGRNTGFDEQEVVAEWQYIKDLSDLTDEDLLLKSYNSNAKRNVKKARKNEITVAVATFDELQEVADLIDNTGSKRHFATKDLAYYQDLFTAFGDKIEFLLTKYNDIPVASGVFIEVNHEFLYLYGGSNGAGEYGKLGGPFLMQHTAMLHALERGLKSYNFYGISGKFDGSDGVLRFKQNFGGYIVEKIGGFRYTPSKGKYNLIQFVKKVTGRK